MSWFYGTYSCGHEGRVNIVGPTKNRQWIADHKFEGFCPDCYAKQLENEREAENAKAAEKAKEMDLPVLTGTEKQVAWATTLRQKFIDNVQEIAKSKNIDNVKINDTLLFLLTKETKASWFIDSRRDDVREILEKAFEEMQHSATTDTISENEIKAESTVFPKNRITENPVEIIVKDNLITAITEKNDTFREIVKSLGYTWNGIWQRKITETTGCAADRAAELGNKLLNAGFPIIITDSDIRRKSVDADFDPECRRWVRVFTSGDYTGWLSIRWEKQNEKLYQAARKLPRSRYCNGSVAVKMEYFKDVLDFAKMFDFKISRRANEEIGKYKNALNDTLITPAVPLPAPLKDGLSEILQSSSEVLDDLKD